MNDFEVGTGTGHTQIIRGNTRVPPLVLHRYILQAKCGGVFRKGLKKEGDDFVLFNFISTGDLIIDMQEGHTGYKEVSDYMEY